MAYNHGREERKWRIWKEAEEKILRKCGVDESVIEQIRIDDRTDFNSNGGFTDGQMTLQSTLREWQTKSNKRR